MGPLKKLIIGGAFEPELAPLKEMLSQRRFEWNSLTNSAISFVEVGIGSVTAAANTSRFLSEALGDVSASDIAVIFVGSAGALPGVTLLSPVVASGVVSVDAALVQGESYLPATFINCEIPHEGLSDLVRTSASNAYGQPVATELFYSTPSITSDGRVAKLIAGASEASIENLELFGVARACAVYGVGWAAIAVLTNHIGPSAHEEWQNTHSKAAEVTAKCVIKALSLIEFVAR